MAEIQDGGQNHRKMLKIQKCLFFSSGIIKQFDFCIFMKELGIDFTKIAIHINLYINDSEK